MWTNSEKIFAILEIEPTVDPKAIKKAYANLVKRFHPEEYPDKWEEIHEAYEAALSMAKRANAAVPAYTIRQYQDLSIRKGQREEGTDIRKPQQESETEEIGELFQNIESLSEEKRRQDEENRKKALEPLLAQIRRMADKRRYHKQEWEDFFRDESLLPLTSSREFLCQLGDCFAGKKINTGLYRFLTEQLALIAQYQADRNIVVKIGVSDAAAYAQSKIDAAYRARRTLKDWYKDMVTVGKAAGWMFVALLVIVGLCLRITAPQRGNGRSRTERIDYREFRGEDDVETQEALEANYKRYDELVKEIVESMELVEIGDTRQDMIACYGEPDMLMEYHKNPAYEQAVYQQAMANLIFVLDGDTIVDMYADSTVADDVIERLGDNPGNERD